MILGIAVGVVILILDKWVFYGSALFGVHPPFWAGLLASLYGSINEEVLLRLFLFTLVYFLFKKSFFKFSTEKRETCLWITTIIIAILFGIGHLPAAFKLVAPSGFEIFRILLLNGIPGIVFGWLYWSKSLFAAMVVHFVTDIVIHGLAAL